MQNEGLDVHAGQAVAGLLVRSDLTPDTTLFQYRPDCAPKYAVSLTMPVVRDPYDAMSGLLPIFDMNLPEGALREELLRAFSKSVRDFDDLALLSIVGQSQIGRLRFSPKGATPAEVPTVDVDSLLTTRGTKALFAELFARYASASGISGAQPKILLRNASAAGPIDRMTAKSATHIVKAFDERRFPELAANEYFCMLAAHHAGLPTPNVRLSDDRQILVVERFDIAADGSYLGFEDLCVLHGVRAHGKYDASYEQIARYVSTYVSPRHQRDAMEQFFLNLALSCALRNGDAHLKNFGVVYADCTQEVRFAPAYDITSTVPYLANDTLALTLDGSKAFPDAKRLKLFGRTHCGLPVGRVRQLLAQATVGIEQAISAIRKFARKHKDFVPMAERLEGTFRAGMVMSFGAKR